MTLPREYRKCTLPSGQMTRNSCARLPCSMTVPECLFQTDPGPRDGQATSTDSGLAIEGARRQSVNRLQFRRPSDSACLQVAFPNAHLAEGEGQAEPLVTVPCLLSGGGDVAEITSSQRPTGTRRPPAIDRRWDSILQSAAAGDRRRRDAARCKRHSRRHAGRCPRLTSQAGLPTGRPANCAAARFKYVTRHSASRTTTASWIFVENLVDRDFHSCSGRSSDTVRRSSECFLCT